MVALKNISLWICDLLYECLVDGEHKNMCQGYKNMCQDYKKEEDYVV